MSTESFAKTIKRQRPFALITSDWNLAEYAWTGREGLQSDASDSLHDINIAARDTGLPIITAGNTFRDRSPSFTALNQLHTLGKNLYYVLGDREPSESDGFVNYVNLVCPDSFQIVEQSTGIDPDVKRSYEWTDWEACDEWNNLIDELYPDKVISDGKSFLLGMNHCVIKERLQESIDARAEYVKPLSYPTPLITWVMHQTCQGFVPQDVTPDLTDGMLPDGQYIVICGSNPKAGITTLKTKSGRSVPVLSPGSIYPLSIDDTSAKYVYALCQNGHLYRRQLHTREISTIDLTGCKCVADCESILYAELDAMIFGDKEDEDCRPVKRAVNIIYPVRFQKWITETLKPLLFAISYKERVPALDAEHVFFSAVQADQTVTVEAYQPYPSSWLVERTGHWIHRVVSRHIEAQLKEKLGEEFYEWYKKLGYGPDPIAYERDRGVEHEDRPDKYLLAPVCP
jgi:hypothetical protein